MLPIQGNDRLVEHTRHLGLDVFCVQPGISLLVIGRFINGQLCDMNIIDDLRHGSKKMLAKSYSLPRQIKLLVRKTNTNRLDRQAGIKDAGTKGDHGSAIRSGAFRKNDKLAQTSRAALANLALAMAIVSGLNTCDELRGEGVALTDKHALQCTCETADDGGMFEFAFGNEGGVETGEQDEDVDVAEMVGDDDEGGCRWIGGGGGSEGWRERGVVGTYVENGKGEEEDGTSDGEEEEEKGLSPWGEGHEEGVFVGIVVVGVEGEGMEGWKTSHGDGGDDKEEGTSEEEVDDAEREDEDSNEECFEALIEGPGGADTLVGCKMVVNLLGAGNGDIRQGRGRGRGQGGHRWSVRTSLRHVEDSYAKGGRGRIGEGGQ